MTTRHFQEVLRRLTLDTTGQTFRTRKQANENRIDVFLMPDDAKLCSVSFRLIERCENEADVLMQIIYPALEKKHAA